MDATRSTLTRNADGRNPNLSDFLFSSRSSVCMYYCLFVFVPIASSYSRFDLLLDPVRSINGIRANLVVDRVSGITQQTQQVEGGDFPNPNSNSVKSRTPKTLAHQILTQKNEIGERNQRTLTLDA